MHRRKHRNLNDYRHPFGTGPRTPQREPIFIADHKNEIGRHLIETRVHDLGIFVYKDIAAETARLGKPGVLATAFIGGLTFYTDLTRNLRAEVPRSRTAAGVIYENPVDLVYRSAFFRCEAYSAENQALSAVRVDPIIVKPDEVRGAYCLFIDDMYDTGATAEAVIAQLKGMGAAIVRTAFMCDKRKRDSKTGLLIEKPIKPDFVGFSVPDKWLVGYGMDDHGCRRDLPHIVARDYFLKLLKKRQAA